MRLTRVAFGQIPFEVRATSNSNEFLLSFYNNGPNALSAMAALDNTLRGESLRMWCHDLP
ncbi:MAG: hypothetical protein QE263_07670 [Vampirovibrionales bacterium]|nr:hypothetical protein [Vampirovibrionales bacterium]